MLTVTCLGMYMSQSACLGVAPGMARCGTFSVFAAAGSSKSCRSFAGKGGARNPKVGLDDADSKGRPSSCVLSLETVGPPLVRFSTLFPSKAKRERKGDKAKLA